MSKYYTLPPHVPRPSENPPSLKVRMATAQSVATYQRRGVVPITLKTPPWAEDEEA
ncbi:hypothetical protein KU6B_47970 [Mameliella alba]|uniref:hypothetical protein n=1 Tax=Mameliella alba TaxID=561184 RepID=UPI0013E43F8A|nr:hypothetical protein [Mameliella alba]BBU58532.1 hypothetical protein KU6B_47970 [Mameliella alba]